MIQHGNIKISYTELCEIASELSVALGQNHILTKKLIKIIETVEIATFPTGLVRYILTGKNEDDTNNGDVDKFIRHVAPRISYEPPHQFKVALDRIIPILEEKYGDIKNYPSLIEAIKAVGWSVQVPVLIREELRLD